MNEQADLSPVYVMTYDHLGIILWQIEALERVLDQEIERLERHPAFKVGWDHEAYTYDHLAAHAPALLDKMRQALARFPGRLGVGTCTYGQPLAQFVNEESNVRQLTVALETVEEQLGISPAVYLMSEHAMHSQMPQLLAACGFKGAILRTHFMMYGYNPAIAAPVVWWVGLDGSRLPAVPTYPGQEARAMRAHAQPFGAVTLDNRILTDYPTYPETLEAFRRRFGAHIRPLVASRADDPRQHEEIVAAHEGDPDYVWVLAEEVLDRLPQPRIDLRPGADDFGVRMPWGFCGNWIWNQSRRAEVSVLTAERLAALGHAVGGYGAPPLQPDVDVVGGYGAPPLQPDGAPPLRSGPDDESDLQRAWKDLLVGQHHDIQIVGLEEDAHRYLDAAISRSAQVAAGHMARLAERIGATEGRRRVAFNPLSWARTDWVETGEGQGFLATVPALGLAAFPISEGRVEDMQRVEWDPGARCLRTAHYEVCLGQQGGLVALIDRQTGGPALAPGRPSGTLAGLIDGQPCESQGTLEVQVQGERALVRERGMVGPIPYRAEWAFYADLPRIDWRCEIEVHGERIGRPSADLRDPFSAFEHEHKLRLRFYPAVRDRAVGVRDLPFAVAETGGRYVEGNYWTAIADGDAGLAILNRGLMGSVREADGAFAVPLAFSMYYVWDNWDGLITEGAVGRGPHFMDGTYRYELAIVPFSGDWRDADLHRRAMAYNFPFLAVQASGLRDPLGQVWAPCQVVGEGAILSALYTRRGHTYARLYEYRGQDTGVSLRWMGHPAHLVEVDLRERPRGALGRTLPLGPWQVRTVEIQ